MASIARKWMISAAAIVALAGKPVIAQEGDAAKDLATCADAGKEADARLNACNRSLDRDRNASVRRWAMILTYRALALKAKGDLDGAISVLNDAIATDPNFAVPYGARADIWRDRGDCGQALADYDRLVQLAPERAIVYVSRGSCWVQKGEYDPAMANFEEAIRLDRDNASHVGALAWTMKAHLHYLKGDLDRALADYDEATKLDADNKDGIAARAWTSKGQIRYAKGDLDGAIANYNEAIRLEPNDATLLAERGRIKSAKSNFDGALADFDQAIKLDPNNTAGAAALAWGLKAGLRFAKDDADGAIADYDQAIRLEPQSAILYVDRGTVWGRKREFARALADFDQTIKLDPDNSRGAGADAWNLKGRAQLVQGDSDGAIAAFEQAIRLDAKFAFAYQNLADVLKEKGEYARAAQSYDRAIELGIKDLSVFASRGLMRFYLGDFRKAAADFTESYRGNADAYSLLLLYLSLTRAGDNAKDALTRGLSQLSSRDWPYPVLELFLGQKSLEAVRGAAVNSDQRCELQYYAGEWYLLQQEHDPARTALQAAVDSCPKDFVEFRAAAAELKRGL